MFVTWYGTWFMTATGYRRAFMVLFWRAWAPEFQQAVIASSNPKPIKAGEGHEDTYLDEMISIWD